MYYGDSSNIKSFDDVLSLIKRLFLSFSLLFYFLYVWGSYISPPLKYSELSELEGFVIEKWCHTPSKGLDEYRFRVQTDDGERQLRIVQNLVENCCFFQEVPLNRRVSLLTNWTLNGINLYQLTYSNKILLDAHDVLEREEENIAELLPVSFVLLLTGGFTYCVELIRKAKKST